MMKRTTNLTENFREEGLAGNLLLELKFGPPWNFY
ncbi:hypothetical protein LMOf2365_1581 [Listeria monocytogenes serotype 4b str. F2365]|nr:hypothetical protein LMOf2365_1581 [Listeria monocytogenes serotype 4b str. F2365]